MSGEHSSSAHHSGDPYPWIATVLTMLGYEGILWLWFQASPNTTLPGLMVVPLVLLLGILKLLATDPGGVLSGLADGAVFGVVAWTCLFHVVPAVAVYRFWVRAREHDSRSGDPIEPS